ncbi:hypothetical protein QQ045_023928 [Rhodiola kirilowii]
MNFLRLSALLICLTHFFSLSKANSECDYYARAGGGCPDIEACRLTCAPCYRGEGRIVAGCAHSVYPMWECRCYFKDGAPCPQDPPQCPGRPGGPPGGAVRIGTTPYEFDNVTIAEFAVIDSYLKE